MQLTFFRRYKLTWCLLVFLFLPFILLGQTTKDLDNHLANGKALLDQQKYALAMTELLPILNAGAKYKSTPQALYLYSVAGLKAKKYQEAKDRLAQLRQQYPDWPNTDEALFLTANIAFEEKDYPKALQTLGEISSSGLEADKAAMKKSYLMQVNSKSVLSSLVQQFPEDKDLAIVYADKLMGGWYTENDKSTLERLVSRFNLDKKKYAARSKFIPKATYKVAVLLPFQLEVKDESQLRKNQFITDLYAGIVLAKDSLAKQNIIIDLFTYDAPVDTNKVKAVLDLPELKTMDMIIGPVYKSAGKIISRFAQQNQIVAINPLSDDLSLVKNNPYLYLFQASLTTQARKSADFAYDNFAQKTGIIVYSNSPDYITYAQAYKAQFEKRGGKIKVSKPISPQSSGGAVYSDVDFSTTGHIMVASNNMSLAVNTISTLERTGNRTPVITFSSWLDINQISLQQLDDQEIYFIYPRFVDPGLVTVREFKKDYKSRFNIPPSEYVYTGFDLMYYFGNMLARHGAQFNQTLGSEGAISGVFFQGIGYQTEHDNQYVPLLKLDNLQLNVVNPIFK